MIRDFMRRWGAVSLIKGPNGSLGVWGGVPMSDMMMDLEAVSMGRSASADRNARVNVSFTRTVMVDHKFDRMFNVNKDDILATTTIGGVEVEKMSWNPKTGETLLVWPGQYHDSVKGDAPFDDYLRIVILHKQRKVTFRPFLPTWATSNMAFRGEDDLADLSFTAQEACERALLRAGADNWTFQYNINNTMLSEMSGRRNW